MNASETRRRTPHVHQWLVYFWPVGFLSLLLFAPDDLHGATFRRSTPSCGLNLNVKTSASEFESAIHSLAFSLCLLLKVSNDCFVLCLQAKRAVQRGATAVIFDVSENPDAIDQVCALLKMTQAPHTRVTTTTGTVCLSVNDAPCLSSEESSAACPALLTGSVCCLYKQWSFYL